METIMDPQLEARSEAPGGEAANAPRSPARPQTFRERHALKVLGVVMAAMFATVIVAQVGC
jgi:hypothetical protein